jgi:hypothetical protein
MEGQTYRNSDGPELRGSNVTLDKITAPTDVSKRRTKIICTLGPACWEVSQLEILIEAGMSIARFNFSHGDHEGHLACLNRLRQACKNKGKHVGKKVHAILTVQGVCCLKTPAVILTQTSSYFPFARDRCYVGYQGTRDSYRILWWWG